MSSVDVVPFAALAMALLVIPFAAYGIAWAPTLGHWENSHYRRPAAFLTIAMAFLAALVLTLSGGAA
jgi:hypothetical protein